MNDNNRRILGNIIVALILSIAVIFSCFIGVNGLAAYKSKRNDIDIKGTVTQQITSDLIVWTGSFNVQALDFKDGYNQLEADRQKVRNYLVEKGFNDDDLIFSAISTRENNVISETGAYTNEIEDYDLSQTITISSNEVDKVTEISRNVTELLHEGIQFQSYAPEYHYTKLGDLKVTMLADATKDATKRAQMIVENAGNKLGDLTHAHVSSIKIAPLNSSVVDNYDYHYVSKSIATLEKEVTVVVYCTFDID